MGTSAFGTWQPMSTAPTDGTWILTYSQDGVIRVAMWIEGAIHEPTHWMPLPPPPKSGTDIMPRGPKGEKRPADAAQPKAGKRGPYKKENSN
jgi:hypothetical protein